MPSEALKELLALAAGLDDEDKRWLSNALRVRDYQHAFEDIQQKIWRPYYKNGYGGQLEVIIERNTDEAALPDKMGDQPNDVLDAIELLHNDYCEILEKYNIDLGE
jgi:hypothetical protein